MPVDKQESVTKHIINIINKNGGDDLKHSDEYSGKKKQPDEWYD